MAIRFRHAAIALSVAALALTGCSSDKKDSESSAPVAENPTFEAGTTMARIADAGKVKVGIKFDQPGFGLQNLSGGYEGFDVEIAKIIAAGLGIEAGDIEFVESPSARREEVIENGTVDFVVATYTINEPRKERVSFAGPYYNAGQQLMVASDNSTITGPDSLKDNPDSKVCSVTGSTPSEQIRPYLANEDQLVLFDVYSKCADALRTGQVQVVTTDNVILLGFAADSDGKFKLVGEQFTEEPYGIGITKADVAFCNFIDEQLTAASESGAYEKAWTTTAGTIEGAETPKLPTLTPCA